MNQFEQDARFAAALEECSRRVQSGERLEQCLSEYPAEFRPELARLVPVAARVGTLGQDPSAEFQARLEQRLLGAVEYARRSQPRPGLLGRLPRLFAALPTAQIVALAVVLLVASVGTGVGVVQASEDSLPDSPLYEVKRAREWLRLAATQDGAARVNVHAEQIAQRGRELQRAVREDKPREVIAFLAFRLAESIDRMVDQALELKAQGRTEPPARALEAIRHMQRSLEQFIPRASGEARQPLQRLLRFLEQQEQRLSGSAGGGQ